MTAISKRAAAFAAVMISACYAPSEGQVHASICASLDDDDACAVADKIVVQMAAYGATNRKPMWMKMPGGTFYRGSTDGQACDADCSDPPDPETDQDIIDAVNALGEDLDGFADYPVFP
jgi:hypothetical protein